ncbi:hypothetical protein D3C87_772970 [compost metagenome]
MPAWSFAAIRPKLDRFFESVRTSLEARAAAGVDRRRLEDFLGQSQSLKERLYTCLESADRSELAAILKDIQVLAYRTRVLFGSPLQGVAWDDLQRLLADMPHSHAPAMGILDGGQTAAFVSGELKDSSRAGSMERTLVAPAPITGGTELVGCAPLVFPESSLATGASLATEVSLPAPVDVSARPADLPDPPDVPSVLSEAPPRDVALLETEPPLASPAAAEAVPGAQTDDFGLPFRVPRLMAVLVFLLGAVAGYAVGGLHPALTSLACGIAAILATRAEPDSLRYNEEST